MVNAPHKLNGGKDWLSQHIPLWVAIVLGGTGAFSGLGNWQWLENNEPRFQANSARIDAQADAIKRIEAHLAAIEARIDTLREQKLDIATSLRNVQRVEAELLRLEQHIDALRDDRSTPRNAR